MSTKQRELKHNELADMLGHSVDRYKNYTKPIVGTVVAIIVLGLLYQYSQSQRAVEQAGQWAQYIAATGSSDTNDLKALGESSPNSVPGGWALVMLGDQKLSQALNDLTTNRGEVRNSLQDAKDAYEKARSNSDIDIKKRATLGLAKTVEALGDLKSAENYYKEVVGKWPGTVFATTATARLKDIERGTTKDFYDWLARKEADVPKNDGPGIPGLRPSGLDSLKGDTSDFKFDASKLDLNKPAETKPAETPKTDGEKTPEKK